MRQRAPLVLVPISLALVHCGTTAYVQPQPQPQPVVIVTSSGSANMAPQGAPVIVQAAAEQPSGPIVVQQQPQPMPQPEQPQGGNNILAIGGSQSNFGQGNLRPGFMPDPQSVRVVSGGGLDARAVGSGCNGWVTRQPDYILHYSGGQSARLRIYAVADDGTDITLVVNDARARWSCNDDSYGGLNPSVDLMNAGEGQYDIWVGSYQQGQQARATLYITELDRHP